MTSRRVAAVLAVIGVLGFLGLQFFGPSDPKPERAGFVITAGSHRATVDCEGDIVGTGFLADKVAAFKACTFDDTVSVHRYLQHGRSACDLLIADAHDPPATFGDATISGFYFGDHIERRIDAVNGDACDRAAWELLAPLLPR